MTLDSGSETQGKLEGESSKTVTAQNDTVQTQIDEDESEELYNNDSTVGNMEIVNKSGNDTPL